MILTRSTRLSQPQEPVEISPDFGGRGVVYLPPVQSGITRAEGTVARTPSPQGISAEYTTAETKIERLNGSAPNGVTEFTQLIYLTPLSGGAVNDRGIFGNWNTTGATGLVQMIHRARDASTNGRYCYVMSYDPTNAAAAAGVRTNDYTAVDGVPSFVVATVKNGSLRVYHNGLIQGSPSSTSVSVPAMSSHADLQIGNYYDNAAGRRLAANVHLAAFLPLGLGASEVAALSRNPWQLFRPVQRRVYFDMDAGGEATTSVSTDLAAEYKIRSTVYADGAGAYAVRSVVAADTSPEYSIRGAISSEVSAPYIVRALAQADITPAYLVRVAVQVDAASTFTVRGAAQADAASTYIVRGGASADATAAYVLRGSAASDATAAYLLRGSTSSDLSASYAIQTASGVSSSVSASYVVRGAAQSDAAAAYDLRKSVGANSEHAFMVRGLVSSDLGSAYEVQAALMPVYADIAASYSIEGPVFGGGLSPADIAAIRAAVRSELSTELTAVTQIQTKVDAAL